MCGRFFFFSLFSFMVEVIGYGGWGERKVETTTFIELNFRHSAFPVSMNVQVERTRRQLGV